MGQLHALLGACAFIVVGGLAVASMGSDDDKPRTVRGGIVLLVASAVGIGARMLIP